MSVHHQLAHKLRAALRDGEITWRSATKALALVLLLYCGSIMSFIGMNFWLWSFASDLKFNFASMLIPALLWLAFFATLLSMTALYHAIWTKRRDNYLFWLTREGVLLIFLVGLFDSLAGLTGVYAAVHVPQILQTALLSTGPVWTFLLAMVLHPMSQPKVNAWLGLVALFIFSGVTLAVLQQVLDKNRKSAYFSAPWTVIFVASSFLFPLYNVLQGRFLTTFADKCTPLTCKFVMLTGEAAVQAVVTLAYFPVDFAPFYGSCSSARESWDNFVDSTRCIGHCANNAKYMMIYTIGFGMHHIAFAYLNTYSPSIAAVTSMLTQPINAFVLLAIPSWNVYGSKKDWRFVLGCFLCLLAGKVLYALWYITFRMQPAVPSAETSKTTAGDDEDRPTAEPDAAQETALRATCSDKCCTAPTKCVLQSSVS